MLRISLPQNQVETQPRIMDEPSSNSATTTAPLPQTSGLFSGSSTFARCKEKGDKCFLEGDHEAAVQAWREALHAGDVSIEGRCRVLCNLSLVLKRLNRLDESLQAADEAIKTDPHCEKGYVRRVSALQAQGASAKAISKALDQGLKAIPTSKLLFAQYAEHESMQGNHYMMNNLGIDYWQGTGGKPRDLHQAKYWLTKSAEGGFHGAMTNLGQLLRDMGQNQEAARWLKAAAMKGSVLGMREAAKMLREQGQLREGAEWAKKAAELGCCSSMVVLANAYFYGEGMPLDLNQAATWYKKAADGGQDLALTYLGSTLCRMGQQQRGFEIYQQAIARKEPTAFSFLGRAYIKMGRMEEAINLMKQALQNPVPRATPAEIADYKAIIVEAVEATQGGGPADRDSSPLYQMSRAGLDKDIRREFRMQKLGTSPQVEFERMEKEAEEGDAECMIDLAQRYAWGDVDSSKFGPAKPNYERAAYWLQRATDAGNHKARYTLGCMYMTGIGVARDEEKAAAMIREEFQHAASTKEPVECLLQELFLAIADKKDWTGKSGQEVHEAYRKSVGVGLGISFNES